MSDVNSNQELHVPTVWTRRFAVLVACCLLAGCGKTLSTSATEQLLASNAVDRSVARIDFTAMAGKTVYFDTSYIKNIKGLGFVNAEYITSALRQQLVAADCRVVEKAEEAEFVVEARVGALGIDKHEVTYGIPASTAITDAASLVPSLNAVPSIPEMAFAKKSDQSGAAKISVFAFHRESREPIWQSGVSEGRSFAKDFWIAGAGPFQSGTIYESAQFAGARVGWMWWKRDRSGFNLERGRVKYFDEFSFPPEEGPALTDARPDGDSGEPKDGQSPADAKTAESESRTTNSAAAAPADDQAVEQSRTKSETVADAGTNGGKQSESVPGKQPVVAVQGDAEAEQQVDVKPAPVVVAAEQSASAGSPADPAAGGQNESESGAKTEVSGDAKPNAGFTTSVEIPKEFTEPRSLFQPELREAMGNGAAMDSSEAFKIFWPPTTVFGSPDRANGVDSLLEVPAAAGTSTVKPDNSGPDN